MNEHKSRGSVGESLGGVSTRALRARRRRLLARVPDLAGYAGRVAGRAVPPLREGRLPVRHRGPARSVRLPVGRAGGRAPRLIYVPAALADLVAEKVAASASVQQVLGEISAINLELLARRELE